MSDKRLLFAPAKVNLSLRVGKKNKASALHAIESSVVFLDLHDGLEVEDREDSGELAVKFCKADIEKESFPVCEDHSLVRAMRALAAAVESKSSVKKLRLPKMRLPWNIVVRKAIPAGAGLGGGSSDAASFLRDARTSLGERGVFLSDAAWLSVARAVGSDVALFFLRGRSNNVVVSGVGERVVERASLPVCGVVLLCGAELSTRAVYESYARDCLEGGQGYAKGVVEESRLSGVGSIGLSGLLEMVEGEGNDLLSAACAVDSSLEDRLKALRSCKGVFCAGMTGSGSACFGLTALGDEEGVASRLRTRGWARGRNSVLATRFLSDEGLDKAG